MKLSLFLIPFAFLFGPGKAMPIDLLPGRALGSEEVREGKSLRLVLWRPKGATKFNYQLDPRLKDDVKEIESILQEEGLIEETNINERKVKAAHNTEEMSGVKASDNAEERTATQNIDGRKGKAIDEEMSEEKDGCISNGKFELCRKKRAEREKAKLPYWMRDATLPLREIGHGWEKFKCLFRSAESCRKALKWADWEFFGRFE